MMTPPRPVLALLFGLSAACDGLEPPDMSTSASLGPLAIGPSLVVGHASAKDLVVLDLSDGELTAIRRIELGTTPSLIVPVRPGTADPSALVLSRDDRALHLVDTLSGDTRTLALGSPFEGLVVSPDARAALAYYPPGSASSVFHNENEVAHIDLSPDLAPELAVTRRTLASLGGAPRLVALSPRVANTRYAFVLSDEHVAVIDLDDPTRPERSIPLVSLTSGGARTPTGVTFGVAGDTLWAVVATAEASSVYALAITRNPGAQASDAGFDVRLSQLPGTGPNGAAALVTLPLDAGDTLFTLTSNPATSLLTLTDVATATGRALTLQSGLDRLHLFAGETGPMALAWSSYSGQTFHVVDLKAMALSQNKAFKTRSARAPFTTLLPIPNSPRFFAIHSSGDQGLSVIDADTDRITSFGRTGLVRDISISENLDHAYVLTRLGQETYLVAVELSTFHPEVALIPDGADALAVLPDAGTVAAITYRTGGLVTLWPLSNTSDATTQAAPGFLLDNVFSP
jgi:hypothetical protein